MPFPDMRGREQSAGRIDVDPRSVLAFLLTIDVLLVALHLVSRWLAFYGEQTLDMTFDAHALLDMDEHR